MSRHDVDDEDEVSEYQQKLNSQIQDELNARGVGSLSWDEVPADLFDEAEKAAKAIVGEDPDE